MRRRIKLDTWQTDDGTWSAQLTVIIPGVSDRKANVAGFRDYDQVAAWSHQQMNSAMEDVRV